MADVTATLPQQSSVVYFISPERSRRVKIGVTVDIASRLRTLEAGNHVRLKVLLTIPGDRGLEGQLHSRFRKHRMHNEWFKLTDEIKAFIFANGGDFIPLSGGYTRGNDATEDEVRAMLAATEGEPTPGKSQNREITP